MTTSEPKPSEPSNFGKVLRAILRTILTLVLVIVIIAALGLAGYYGYVYIHNEAVVPAQNARASSAYLSTRQAQTNLSLTQISAQVAQLADSGSQNGANIASLKSSVSDLQTAVQNQSQTLSRLDGLEVSLNSLSQRFDANSTTTGELQATLAASDFSFQDLQVQIKLLQAMELLNRSRLYMQQSNYGLASSDIDSARQILLALQPSLPSYQQQAAGLWIQRLNLVSSDLPTYPTLAANDLDMAWGMLAGGLPSQPSGTPTPSFMITTGSPSPTINGPGSPVVTDTLSPTYTPYPTPSENPYLTPAPTGSSSETPTLAGR
jgi:hypothetical protein